MAYSLDDKMVIGVSSRALFDMSVENEIFENEGVEAYAAYQIEHENEVLKPGPGFELIKKLLRLNESFRDREPVEVVIMSRNSSDTSIRVFNSIDYYGLKITRAVLASGASLAPDLSAFKTDLFLSAYEDDMQSAIDSGIAAGIICTNGDNEEYINNLNALAEEIRIAFDGDAVVFSDESEQIYQAKGLSAFEENEAIHADTPLSKGPFAKFLIKLSILQKEIGREKCPIRTALVTARSAPAHMRVLRTLRSWNVGVDEVFFLGGMEKKEFLKAFGAHIFFDDQSVHIDKASEAVPSARVPYRRSIKENESNDP